VFPETGSPPGDRAVSGAPPTRAYVGAVEPTVRKEKEMKFLPGIVLAALVAVVVASPAAAGGAPTVILYPAAVNVQMLRTTSLLDKAATYQDEGDPTKAVAALTAARSHLRKAWIAAKFVIDTAPPPAAPASLSVTKAKNVARPRAKAHSSGTAPVAGASPYADQYTTALGVLDLQHQVASMMLGMLDTAAEPLLTAMSSTIFAALNARDSAIAYIKSKDVAPPAPLVTSSSVKGGVIAGAWGTVMPTAAPALDDELQLVDELRATLNLSSSRKKIIDAVELQDVRTSRTINTNWPPVVGA
jgi:hypothetical protein